MKIKNTSLVLLTFCFLTAILNAQDPSFDWVKQIGSTTAEIGISVSTDSQGNVYSTGTFTGTVDFDPGAEVYNLTAISQDSYVQKLDENGNLIWVIQIEGTISGSNASAASISIDAEDNIFTTGFFSGTVDFDPSAGTDYVTSVGSVDIFICKLDVNGNLIWAKQMGGISSDQVSSICNDSEGNVYTTGWFQGTSDFDPGVGNFDLVAVGNQDIFVQKLDPDGNFVWVKQIGGTNNEKTLSIISDVEGNLITTGIFAGTVDFDPGDGVLNLTSNGSIDIFIQKIDSSGTLIWAKGIGGTSLDYGQSVTTDVQGNVYATGGFGATVDFDPGTGNVSLTSGASQDIFILKLDINGNYEWVKQMTGTIGSANTGISIVTDTDDNLYTTGLFNGLVDFDPGEGVVNLNTTGAQDIFIQKLDSFGDFLWVGKIGGISNDGVSSIAIDNQNNIYTIGYFKGTVDFDPGIENTILTAVGVDDAYVHKLNQCLPSIGTDTQTACDTYTWIDGEIYTSSNNTANFALTNTAGCDSTVTLNLTINNSTSGTDVITSCDSYMWMDGNSYTSNNNSAQWILTNAGGCDSIVTLDLTINSVSDLSTSVTGNIITANNSAATYQWLDCDDNYNPINGETNQSFTALVNGNYAVQLGENGCTDTSSCVLINSIGILENLVNSDPILIYPNPTKGVFTIDFQNLTEIPEVRVVSVTGQEVNAKYNIVSKQLKIELLGEDGLYILQIETKDGGTKSIKILKNSL